MEITRNITKSSIKTGKFIVLLLSFILLFNCTTSTHTPAKRHKNLSYLYNDSEAFLHPQYQIYNFSNDSSEIFFKIPFKDLLSKRISRDTEKYAVVEIHYRLFESLSIASLIDSSTILQKIIIDKTKKEKTFSFKIKTPFLTRSYLRIQVKDLFSERSRKDYLEIDKISSVNRQSFLFRNTVTKEPLYGNNILLNSTYRIGSPLFEKYKLFVQEQENIKSVPNLPFSTQKTPSVKFKSDTTYSLEFKCFETEKAKLYYFTFDTTKLKGVAFYVYDSLTNSMHTPSQMIEPLTYLLSPKEYQNIQKNENPKLALDKFWLKSGENKRHAKEMIKVYYTRVARSNKYYSSYKKGWMTDRGMIYTIYGEPATIYKSETLERWIYGSEESDMSLSFDFRKQHNPFSNNDYELIRDEIYKKSWFQAIDSWRNGRIYSIAK